MNCFLPLFILCFEILGKYTSTAINPGHEVKPSSFKAKLSKEEFTSGLKKKSSSDGSDRFGKFEASSTLKWEDATLDFTPPPEYANDTVQYDSHTYYNSTFYKDPKDGKMLWIDIDSLHEEKVVTHEMLSNSHRQATTVELSFDFPFYGSYLRNITIATGGFLYMGDYLHNWIAATQYIAPLMANFDTTLSNGSTIKYADNGTVFTVQWDHAHLQERQKDGAFTFQVNLFKTGDISFVYKDIPIPVANISDEVHPVKIGLSDAYILERTVFFIRRKTIYEYHRIDLLAKGISNNTALYFTALPTCLEYKDCGSCMAAAESLECLWCEAVQRCSDGVDRLRQSWVANACTLQHASSCPAQKGPEVPIGISTLPPATKEPQSAKSTSDPFSTGNTEKTVVTSKKETLNIDTTSHPFISEKIQSRTEIEERVSVNLTPGAIVTIVVFIAVVMGIGLWLFYAYRFPQSTSGQFLIKYRPSTWSLKVENRDNNSNNFRM